MKVLGGGNSRMVAPVWYNIRRTGEGKYELGGEHDVDVNWMKEVRGEDSRGDIVGRILPRFSVEQWDKNAYQELAETVEAAKTLINLIVEQVTYGPFYTKLMGGNTSLMGLLWRLLFRIISRSIFHYLGMQFMLSRGINVLWLSYHLTFTDTPPQKYSIPGRFQLTVDSFQSSCSCRLFLSHDVRPQHRLSRRRS